MGKALKRTGWLLIAISMIALAYHIGNRTAPSIPFEPTPYDPADLAPPTPIAEDLTMTESLPSARNSAPKARIISLTAVSVHQAPRNPSLAYAKTQEAKPPIQITGVQSLPGRESSQVISNPVTISSKQVNRPQMLPSTLPDIQRNIRPQVPKVQSNPPRVAGVSDPGYRSGVVAKPANSKAPTTRPSTIESTGLVFLEPHRGAMDAPGRLPASVIESAPLLATQKLINRSLGSPTGVAARLANVQGNPQGSAPSPIMLTRAESKSGLSGLQLDEDSPKAYTTTGVVNFRASKEEIAAQAHLDYVTSGLVILPAREATIRPPTSVQELVVKKAILKACGTRIQDLQINLEPNDCLKIRLSAADPSDEESINRTILTLPELASYQINLLIKSEW